MRIGMLLMGGTYPPDIRVEKEAKVLAAAGHQVFLLASDRDGRPTVEQVGPIEVRRYRAVAGKVRSKLSAAVTLATWRSPLWQRDIAAYVRENGIDALHVHDLPAVATAVAVARANSIRVVFDMHENYPAAVSFWDRRLTARVCQTPARYESYERWAVNAVDHVVAVVDESAERIQHLGVDRSGVSVFSNVDDAANVTPWQGPMTDSFVVAYAGGFGPHRGIDVLIRAFSELRRELPEATLLMMGAGSGEAEMKALAASLGVADSVMWTGWIDEAEMRRRLSTASVGVVPHLKNAHTDSTVPHKLFQYMAMGLPVSVTDCAPLARIVSETGAGTVATAGDACDLAEKIALLRPDEAARAASEAGVLAVNERYNLETEGRSLSAIYEQFAAES